MPRRKLADYSEDVLDRSFDDEDDDLLIPDSSEGEYVQGEKINMRKGYYPYFSNNSDRYDDEY